MLFIQKEPLSEDLEFSKADLLSSYICAFGHNCDFVPIGDDFFFFVHHYYT